MANKKNEKVGLSTDGAVIIGAVVGAILFLGGGAGLFLLTGLVKFNSGGLDFSGFEELGRIIEENTDVEIENTGGTNTGGTITGGTSEPRLVDNPNPRVRVNGRLAEARNLEFYLPYAFSPASNNGKGGVYTYNLINDDGWADVKVYVEKSSLSPEKYLAKLNSSLKVTDRNYRINGTSWVQAENGSVLAYATNFNGDIYAVVYGVKLESDATSEAMQMIPKTLRMKKIYQ
ncbi:hypothetical protein IJI91_00675 [Candidatus Saccharibacteria bacterium]|nr:hypothetical protein [Candidatus Saccharibacteria bacterium]